MPVAVAGLVAIAVPQVAPSVAPRTTPVALFQVAFAQSTTTSTTTDFLSILPEIPLPAGFVEYTEEAIVFDKPEGRIAEAAAFATLETDKATVEQFYSDTLPSLGWQAVGDWVWLRDGEQLTVEVSQEATGVQVRFLLRPVGA